jgi:transcription termination factor Rho
VTEPAIVYATRHVPLARAGDPSYAHVPELATCLALGQRALVVGPPRSGVTAMLRQCAVAIAREVPDAVIDVVLVDRPVEEFMEWRADVPGATVHGTSSEDPPEEQADVAHVFDEAAAAAREGEDRVVVVDSLASLARALNASMDHDERILSGGIMQVALRATRELFGRGRAYEGGGSLTIIGGAAVDSQMELDDVVFEELVGTGNMELRMNAAARAADLWPPVDVERSGARHAELIIGDEEAARRASLRAIVIEHGPLAGLALLLEELDAAGSLESVLELFTRRHD